MSRAKGVRKNSGKSYSVKEYNFIFQCMIRGIEPVDIGRALERTVDEIRNAFRRVCRDASEYDNEKIHNLTPITDRPIKFNGSGKLFVELQRTVTRRSELGDSPSALELSKKTGIPKEAIHKYIVQHNDWVKKPQETLLTVRSK